jgi:hypothetical protein
VTDRLYECIYASQVVVDGPPGALEQMLADARVKNHALSITGCLVFTGRHFIQLLEGPENEVRLLLLKIEADPRHRDFRALHAAALASRRFSTWSMRFIYDEAMRATLDRLFMAARAPRDAANDAVQLMRAKAGA